MSQPAPKSPRLTKTHYEALSLLRYNLRQFLHFSQAAARAGGISPQQHQALLAIKGFPGRDQVSVGEIAERLNVQHHSAVGLVDRLARRRLVRRSRAKEDRRRVCVELTAQGQALIERLSAVHLQELRDIGPKLRALLKAMDNL